MSKTIDDALGARPEGIDRRTFLKRGTAVAAAASLFPLACGGGSQTGDVPGDMPDDAATAGEVPDPAAPIYKISLAEWSLHNALFAGELTNLEFPVAAKEAYGITAVEYVNIFMMEEARDPRYILELKDITASEGVENVLIMCDREGRLGDPDTEARMQAVENHYRWVEAARELGCHSIRVNAASEGEWDTQRDLAADGLRRLTEFGAQADINVIVENHGGLSSNADWLAAVMEQVDHPMCGTLPDFGNFRIAEGEWYDIYEGVEKLMPYAKAVSAKSHNFDDEGNEADKDYMRLMRIVLDAGYRGYVGIEYEGTERPEHEGIALTRDLLLRVREELQSEYA